ncbi:MAG: efflux RND transporter periplasmic adaptor subunit [Odoribacter sp.]
MKIQKFMMILSRKLFLITVCATLFACGNKQKTGQGGVPDYAVITIQPSQVTLNSSYPASIRGKQDVEIRPNVSGFITKLCVDEGATVRKGQTLFLIDPVQYEEAVNVANAAVNVANASVATAQLTAENKRELAKKNIISQYDLQMAENSLTSQKAVLAQAQAQLTNAQKNLSYTHVVSPSDGIVGTMPFRVGSLVSPSSSTPLTSVSDISEMYVYFSMNEKDVLYLIRQGNGSSNSAIEGLPEVELRLVDGSIYPEKGKISTLSGMIDRSTGAASIRAIFNNSGKILRSGGSGNVMIPTKSDSAIIIPQKATYEIQNKRFAFIVTDSSTVKSTEIIVLPQNDGQQYMVIEGLKIGDRIVTEGVGTSVKDGMKINPITPEQAADNIKKATQHNADMGTAKK